MKKEHFRYVLIFVILFLFGLWATINPTGLTTGSIADITGAAASVAVSPTTVEQGGTLKITITPTKSGVYKYIYFYNTNNVLQDTIAMSCIGNICFRKETLYYTVNFVPGDYYTAVYDYSINDYIKSYFTVVPAGGGGGGFSIGVSPALSSGVTWASLNPNTNDNPADGNNGNGVTSYYITISTTGKTLVDLYVRGNGDLIYLTNNIPLANEKFNYNGLDNTVPGATRYSLTTNYIDNKIGANLKNKGRVNLKFYLNVPNAQAPGSYSNQIEFKGVLAGTAP